MSRIDLTIRGLLDWGLEGLSQRHKGTEIKEGALELTVDDSSDSVFHQFVTEV
ncbi:hypothetical protein Q31b_41000 [Novipirellula aureliae]|uniref:Uncharacterized protein n=1 Tax=Novipirellula aureliae TaxID=2527966 RepID=A0A5C6DW17_9BACT|nr:hypothetical protein Q31b_41000 [Novipirellula aureliae]